jgi:hypothetical protein
MLYNCLFLGDYMNEIRKVCANHGELAIENIYIHGGRKRCKICKDESDRKWRENNKERFKETTQKWKQGNKDKISEWQKNNRKENPEKVLKRERKYKEANREKINAAQKEKRNANIEEYRKKEAEQREKNRENIRINHAAWTYGLTKEEYISLINSNDGKCYICGNEEKVIDSVSKKIRRICIDHDHSTGKVRGLLCNLCNSGLGKFKDSIDLIEKALDYLKRYKS